jgi:DNA-binding SARP family transcriptional activator/predicted ATPase
MDARLLGPLEVDVAGAPLHLGGPQQRALLARLMLDGNRTVAVDRLVDDLWGEDVPETAIKMIHVHVSRLRKLLPDGVLLTRSPGYVLELEPEALDLVRFDRLRADGRSALGAGAAAEAARVLRNALELWRGPALAEFDQPFAVTEAARLEELRLSCVEDRIDADLALGRHADVVGELESLIATHPLRERLRGQLMLALYGQARQAEALAAYREFRRFLSDELGIEPSRGLRELEREILQQKPVSSPGGERPRRPAPQRRARQGGFVGRVTELDRLHESFGRTLDGDRRLVFITGEPGLGKTALAERFLADASTATDVRVGVGQCLEHSGPGEPYLPLLDALARLCRAPGGDELVELMARQAPSWLAQMPSLVPEERAEIIRAGGDATRQRMLREILELLDSLAADRPLLLLLEDLHWCDQSTIDVLAGFGRRSAPARVLMLGTYRKGEVRAPGRPLDRVAQELRVRGLCYEVSLEALGVDALDEYVAQRFPERSLPAGFSRVLSDLTGGNPLFVENVLRAWIDEGALDQADGNWTLRTPLDALEVSVPDSLRQLIGHQLHRLSAEDRELLGAASVVGPWFPTALCALAGVSVEVAERRCHALAEQGQFIVAGDLSRWPDGTVASTYRFQHELYREVLYHGLPLGQRAVLHRRIGARLEEAHGERVHNIASELADHFLRGGDAPRAVDYLQVAAERALATGADRDAIGQLERALKTLAAVDDQSEREQRELPIRVLLGNALMAARGYAAPEVGESYTRARELCERVEGSHYLLPVLAGLSAHAFDRGRHREALAVGRELFRLAEQLGDPAALAARRQIAWPLLCMGRFAEARDQLTSALVDYDPHDPLARLSEAEPGIFERLPYAWALWFLGLPDQAIAVAGEAAARSQAAVRPLTRAYTLGCDAMLRQFSCDRAGARKQAEAALAVASEHDLPLWRAWASVPLGWALSDAGETEEGIATIRWAIDAAEETGAVWGLPYFMASLAEAQWRAGDAAAGLDTLAAAREIAERNDERFFEAEIHRVRGGLLLESGAAAETAEAAFELALEVARRQQSPSLELRSALELGRLWRERGRQDQAARLVSAAYGSFTEGFETPDLVRARRFLDELGAAGLPAHVR